MSLTSKLKPGTVHKIPFTVASNEPVYRYDSPKARKDMKITSSTAYNSSTAYKPSDYVYHTDIKPKKSKFEDEDIEGAFSYNKAMEDLNKKVDNHLQNNQISNMKQKG